MSLTLATGGLERLLVDFARFHDRNTYHLDFVALGETGRPADEIRAAGCTVHQPRLAKSKLARFNALAGLLRELQPDVLHTHNAAPHWNGTLAARWARVPVVINTRHGQRYGQSLCTRMQFWLASLWTDRIVAVSEDAARLTRHADHVATRRVTTIWNGIDTERFRYCGPSNQLRAITVARLSPEKDFPTLLRAFYEARLVVPELLLDIVGSGEMKTDLEWLAHELDLKGAVRFLGERADVPALLSEAGFFVNSSLTEGISLTLLEAMAVGLPVLATSVGGNPEVIQHGVTGMLVPPANPHELAGGLIRMCQERNSWQAMGRAGRQRVQGYFDIRTMIARYEALYMELLPSLKTPCQHPV